MNDMTPEALRKFPTRVRWGQTVAVMTKAQVDAAASAWEADRSRIEALERERDEAIAEVRFQTEHGLTSWVLDAVLQLGWTPPAALAAGVGLAHTREEEAMSEMTPEKAETRVVREGYCYLCEADLNEGRGHRDYCPWPNIRAAWEADRSAKKSWEDAVNLTVEMLSQAVPPLTGGGLYRSVERLLKAYLQRQARIEALEKENRALRANASKSVLRRLEDQGALAAEKPPACDCVPGHLCELHAGEVPY